MIGNLSGPSADEVNISVQARSRHSDRLQIQHAHRTRPNATSRHLFVEVPKMYLRRAQRGEKLVSESQKRGLMFTQWLTL